MGTFIAVVFCCLVGIVIVGAIVHTHEQEKIAKMPPREREEYLAAKRRATEALQTQLRDQRHGQVNQQMVCPHCQTRGTVRTKAVKLKKGISGGKATAALLTGGTSLLATGLSRKEGATASTCDSCHATWYF